MSARNPLAALLTKRVPRHIRDRHAMLRRKPNRGKKDDDLLIPKPKRWGKWDKGVFWVDRSEGLVYIDQELQLDLLKFPAVQNLLRRQVGQGWGWVKQMLRYYARGHRDLHARIEDALIQIQSGQCDLFWVSEDGTLASTLPGSKFMARNGRRPRGYWTHMDVLDAHIREEEARVEREAWEDHESDTELEALGLTREEAEAYEQQWEDQWNNYEADWAIEWRAEQRLERELGRLPTDPNDPFWQAVEGAPFSSHLDVLNAYADYLDGLSPYGRYMRQVEEDLYNDWYDEYYSRMYDPEYDGGYDDAYDDPFEDYGHEEDIIPSGYEAYAQAERERKRQIAHYQRELRAGRNPKTPDGKTVTDVIHGVMYTREDMEWYEQSLQDDLRADHAWDIAAQFGYQDTVSRPDDVQRWKDRVRADRRRRKPGRAKYGPQWAKHARRCDPTRHLTQRKRAA